MFTRKKNKAEISPPPTQHPTHSKYSLALHAGCEVVEVVRALVAIQDHVHTLYCVQVCPVR